MNDPRPLMLERTVSPPSRLSCMLAAIRQRCINAPFDLAASALALAALAWLLWHLLSWAVFHSAIGTDAQGCQTIEGACWSVVRVKWRLVLFGLYPYEAQWRSAVASIIAIGTIVVACVPSMWTAARMICIWFAGYALFLLFIHGGVFGLSVVPSLQWGGFTLTLFIYITVIAFGLPISIGLALLRRSRYPAFRWLTAFVVDVTRSLPLLTILFAATVIIPLMLPDLLQGNKLTRALVGFTFFFACYQSEIVRGGLQAVPSAQEEAAQALGLGYWRTMGLIMLPQAFRIAMPSTINQFVITFKETSLVIIVGLFDLMASAQTAFQSGQWSGFYKEVYLFVALIYFTGSFCLSRYGKYVERRFSVKR
ncbi:amino acid ABC transporter permease [Paraburkholderia sediminicola]|uniref:amino acid ABC transporter permease n=1 Tax=Paraburkholderia sediminicola TaxID=458836 RepID=UPI0038B8619A